MRPLKLLSLFSGIGAPERALENEGIPFELVAYCEVDPPTAKAYSLIHSVDESMNLGDITKVNPQDVPDCDLIMHGSPCQSFSIVGKKQGGSEVPVQRHHFCGIALKSSRRSTRGSLCGKTYPMYYPIRIYRYSWNTLTHSLAKATRAASTH